ncbi:hypothetical protein ABVT39_016135 [Epinephelus coioides]
MSIRDSGLENVLAKCRKLVGHFKHSPANAAELRRQQEESLIQDVSTRYVTELLGGEQYISCSVVLPALCHLFRVMEGSDNDPGYVLRFKAAFTSDLSKRKESTNVQWLKVATALDRRFKDLKCLPRSEMEEVWTDMSLSLEELCAIAKVKYVRETKAETSVSTSEEPLESDRDDFPEYVQEESENEDSLGSEQDDTGSENEEREAVEVDSGGEARLGRQRKRPNPETWKTNVQKRRRMRGQSYVGRKNKETVLKEAGNINADTWEEHCLKKDMKQQDKEEAGEKTLLVCMDLQGLLLCPKLQASALYYKTKLSIHNFTIFDMVSHDVTNYLWHEGEAGLSANEFASCIVNYLEARPSYEEYIIWKDRCGYQNRNLLLSNALLKFATEKQKPVTQKYLERGHTQMECDSVHSVIERRLKHRDIHVPAEYAAVIQGACSNPRPYQVKYVDHTFSWTSAK